MPKIEEIWKATFSDDTAAIGTAKDLVIFIHKRQNAADNFLKWAKKWKVELSRICSFEFHK